MARRSADASQPLQGVNTSVCAGCDRQFRPNRSTQLHCRPGCRVLVLRRRRDQRSDLFTSVADAVELAVLK